MKDMRRSKQQPGFTLIEVLIVVSVIAVLVTIVVPAFGRARDRVRVLGCLSNQRQITVGMTAYAHESVSQSFHADLGRGSTDDLSYLYRGGYLEAYGIAVCPSTENVVEIAVGDHFDPTTEKFVHGMDYRDLIVPAAHAHDDAGGHSYELFHVTTPGQFPNGVSMEKAQDITLSLVETVMDPTETFICIDSDHDPVNGGINIDGLFGYNNLPDAETNNHGDRGGNVAFLDGSARFIPLSRWLPTMVYSTHVGAMNLKRAQEIEPGYRVEPRTDGVERGKRYYFVN